MRKELMPMDISDKTNKLKSLEMIVSSSSVAVILLHNHPSTQTFSLEDVPFFVQHPMLEVIVVVSNQGTVHYLKRDKDFD